MELNTYCDEYYNQNKPSISDLEYDSKYDELSKLEQETQYILSNSPTQHVGYEVKSKLNKVEHSIPLLSLDKTKTIEGIKKFMNNKECLLMLKADGLTCELIYDKGKLIQASTRGNGIIGENITHNTRKFKNIPLTISYDGYLKIAGEAIIHWNDFYEINSKLSDDDKYKTPRNLSSGSVRQLDSKICDKRNVYFYAFNVIECDTKFTTKYNQFIWLNDLGFATVYNIKINAYDNIQSIIDDMIKLAEEKFVPIDGMVISFNDIAYANSLGKTSKFPLHSIAYKFKQDSEETILRSIEWQVGRTGVITPVAYFDTVILDNTEVSKASLHNLSIMEKLEIGLYDRITVIKANQIIPQIEDNLTKSNNIDIPDKCPVCGYATEIKQENDSKTLNCTNDNCPAKLLKKVVNFVKRDAMNIEGLSEATLEKFINKGLLSSFADIYYLDTNLHKEEILKMDGFGQQSYNKLLSAIEKSKYVKLENFINALGIEGVGFSNAKLLAKKFKTIDNFIHAKNSELLNIDGIGEITLDSISEYLYDNLDVIDELMNILTFAEEEKKVNVISDNPFSGKKVYATGTFANYKKEEIQKLLVSLGAEFASGYAKSLDYLIVGSIKGSSKEDKAKKDKVPVLSEQQFNEMIGKIN